MTSILTPLQARGIWMRERLDLNMQNDQHIKGTKRRGTNWGGLSRVQDPKKRATADTILQHPWMKENGTASDKPLDNVILSRMRNFAGMNKLKKEALKVIATGISTEEIAGLRSLFQVCSCAACGGGGVAGMWGGGGWFGKTAPLLHMPAPTMNNG